MIEFCFGLPLLPFWVRSVYLLGRTVLVFLGAALDAEGSFSLDRARYFLFAVRFGS
jgi:hypothetical protein